MTYNSLQGIFTTMIGFVTWPPFCTIIFIRWPSDKANHSCENALQTIVCHSSKKILNKMFNFLALLDIRVFGRLYLWLLIGLALFLQPGCFCLA